MNVEAGLHTNDDGQEFLIVPRDQSGMQLVLAPGDAGFVSIGHNDSMRIERFEASYVKAFDGTLYPQLVFFSKKERRRIAIRLTTSNWLVAIGKLFDSMRRHVEWEEGYQKHLKENSQ
jgi:hypothetical protein